MDNLKTEEKILLVALDLFSQKGYSGVSVRDISKVIGISQSALYKHYRNKEDILNKIIEEVDKRLKETYLKNAVPNIESQDLSGDYKKLAVKKLSEISWNIFQLYVKDNIVSSYRKLLCREQYNNDYAKEIYDKTFISGPIENESHIFDKFVKDGFFRKENPQIIAMHFYAPIFLMFQMYDIDNSREDELKLMIKEHVRAFSDNYRLEE